VTAESADMIKVAKIAISGGFGVGKTTLIGAISEVMPLTTESIMTEAAAATDPAAGSKTATTVAMDFGRITLEDRLVLYLFGTPGQQRFWFMWDEICTGAIGAIILADTRRLDAAFPAMDFFGERNVPYVVAVNTFSDALSVDDTELRQALAIDASVPVITCDARDRAQVRQALITVVEHAIRLHLATAPAEAYPTPIP
jgi:signal recognition particle receptor subunit beta